MIRGFSLAGIVCLAFALFWYSRSGGAVTELPVKDVAAPAQGGDCLAVGSCPAGVETPAPERSKRPLVLEPADSSRENFRHLTQEAWDAIPLKSTLQVRTSGELHGSPPELITAAERVGQVEEALDANPELWPQGLKFFKSCAVNSEFPTSMRALCYHRLRGRLLIERADELTATEVPDDVRALAEQLE